MSDRGDIADDLLSQLSRLLSAHEEHCVAGSRKDLRFFLYPDIGRERVVGEDHADAHEKALRRCRMSGW